MGMLTQRFMRIEKFIPFWAEDLNSETTPFETGSGYLVKLDVCSTIVMLEGLVNFEI